MPYATTSDGVRLYFEEVGAGEPLLLISGQGADHTALDLVRDDFAEHYRIIVFDFRGTGVSDKPAEPQYSTRVFAQDAIAILDHLNIPRAHIYGISMGGCVGQWLGIDFAARIGALILGCSRPGSAHEVPRAPEVDAALANRAADPDGAMTALLEMILSPTWIAAYPDQAEAIRKGLANTLPAYALQQHYLASRNHNTWDLLPTISAPTLIIHGSEDYLAPTANAHLLAERIPTAELHLVAGGRHGYVWEFREEASRIVKDFLARYPLPLASTTH